MRGISLPPRGSVQSAIMEEMVHRERVRDWKRGELHVITSAYSALTTDKLLEQLVEHSTSIMQMALHYPGAYDLKEKPATGGGSPSKSDSEYLGMLDSMPDSL